MISKTIKCLETSLFKVGSFNRNYHFDRKLMELLRFICRGENQSYSVSFKDIKKGLHVSYPTVRKRVGWLARNRLVVVVARGNKKVVHLTKKGRLIASRY